MRRVPVMIATPLEAELVARIEMCDPRVDVWYEPALLPVPRYPCDHHGEEGFARDAAGEARWRELLAGAEVLYGIPGESADELAAAVRANPRVRWVQAMWAGAGELVAQAALSREELARVAFTSAAGVHAVPLAEFAMLGILAFRRGLPGLLADARERRWRAHAPVPELDRATLLVIGAGSIGRRVAALAAAFGMRVIGVRRRAGEAVDGFDEMHGADALRDLLPAADAVVVALPMTHGTAGMLGRDELAAMRRGAILVNVGRGGVVDEPALVDALRSRRLAGAALDVFAQEPLPPGSPLWELPNVILSPHTAAMSARENERIVDLFCDNLRRYLDGRPLRSRIDVEHFY